MRGYLKPLIYLFFILFLHACVEKEDSSTNKTVWSSSEPLDIPLKRRQNEMAEKNKVINPSFENGRFFRDHVDAYEINGWKQIGKLGNEVEWVDTNIAIYNRDEVFSGRHAIKIHNKQINETEEQGVGVISDFIKVIPGNYNLTFHIKLQDVCSYRSRFGNRLMDAVNIRVYYYDKNKIQLSGEMINPEDGGRFDNEFKAFPFSGFWQIDSLNWTKARGISHKFPFLDGDIPDEARYVRLFFGLKGTGTMWIDDISFQYTHHNFSLAERLRPFKAKNFQKHELIVPQPQNVQVGEDVALFNAGEPEKLPLILIPGNASEITMEAAKALKNHLTGLLSNLAADFEISIPVRTHLNPHLLGKYSVVFSLGDNEYNKTKVDQIPLSEISPYPEGYVIHRLKDTSNVVVLQGTEDIGDYYAVQTILQLLETDDLKYTHANITDYPDYLRRGLFLNPEEFTLSENLRAFSSLRFNSLYLNANAAENFPELLNQLRKIKSSGFNQKLFTNGLSINPYRAPFYNETTDDEKPGSDFQLRRFIQKGVNLGFEHLLLRMDQFYDMNNACSCMLNGETLNKERNIHRDLTTRHTELVGSAFEWSGNKAKIDVLPVWHRTDCIIRSHGTGELYLSELFRNIPSQAGYVWTGATENPLIVDNIEIERIEKITHRNPVFFCKDLNPYSSNDDENYLKKLAPGKLRMSSMFEHFEIALPFNGSAEGRIKAFLTDTEMDSPLDQIKIATLANYNWNAEKYDPDLSLLKVLITFYGKDEAFQLIEFNELYQGIREMCIKIESEGYRKKFQRTAENYFTQLTELMRQIELSFTNKNLIEQLRKKVTEAKNLYTDVVER